MLYENYEIIAVGGSWGGYPAGHPEVEKAIKTKKTTVWIGGNIGICDDWGKPVQKPVKKIVKYIWDTETKQMLSEEVIYDNAKTKKK